VISFHCAGAGKRAPKEELMDEILVRTGKPAISYNGSLPQTLSLLNFPSTYKFKYCQELNGLLE
jgi:hypothetical protein